MNDILIRSRRSKLAGLRGEYPAYAIFDLTKNSPDKDMAKFSPFYPHGGIPVPFSDLVSESVEGIWQGLKVFRLQDGGIEDIDRKCFANRTQKHLKRSLRARGRESCLGHRRISDGSLLGYVEARKQIYVPSYRYVLERHLQREILSLVAAWGNTSLLLLDYATNTDLENPRKPLSHAAIVRQYLLEHAQGGRSGIDPN